MPEEKDMSDIEAICKVADTGASIVERLMSRLFRNRDGADEYLRKMIVDHVHPTEDDLLTAAELYNVGKWHSHYRNLRKIYSGAGTILEKRVKLLGELDQREETVMPESLPEDWLDYFDSMAEVASDEVVQSLFQRLLATECLRRGTVRKVVISRMALLDRDAAESFCRLCSLTVRVSIGGLPFTHPVLPAPRAGVQGVRGYRRSPQGRLEMRRAACHV